MSEPSKSKRAKSHVVTPPQRAAIVIAMMGETAARPIMEKLDDAALARVNEALKTIALIPRLELTEIVVEFLNELRQTSGELLGGKVEASEIIANIVEVRKEGVELARAQGVEAPGDTAKTAKSKAKTAWTKMATKPPEKVAVYINGLSPNLASLILRRLEVTFTSEILNTIDEDKLQPIMERLIESENVDPGIESVLERMVELEFLNSEQPGEAEEGEHLEGVGEILSLIPSNKRNPLVEFLRSHHESKLESIQKALFTLDSLPELMPKNGVSVVFREYGTPEMTELLSTLTGPLEPVVEFLLTNISSRLSDSIREELATLTAPSPEECEGVQRVFLLSLMTMKRKGVITLLDKPKPDAA